MFKSRVLILLVTVLAISCNNGHKGNKKVSEINNDIKQRKEEKLKSLIDSLTVDTNYGINDVRRYGLLPNKNIGAHPNTKNQLMNELIRLAEYGQSLDFPSGYYKTSLILSGKSNISLSFNGTQFAGGIMINGTEKSPSRNIDLKGKLSTYSSFSSSFIDMVSIDSLLIKNNKQYHISNLESGGCNIYVGTLSLYINYLEIEGTGSESDQFRYTPAALMIHGNSPKPHDVLIKEAYIHSSDRHGAYLFGSFIEIERLTINSYGLGEIDNMSPIAYTKQGDEKRITGLWLNRFDNSTIKDLIINTESAIMAENALYLDNGDMDFPSYILNLKINGDNKGIRKAAATNVNLN